MYLRKEGFPEVGEIVLCTVKKILHNAVFVSLDEYNGREGLVHISEVSPGRIRNLRDFVREGKVIVCKVLRINEQKGHIDLSLRRVNLAQRKNKIDEVSQENRAEKLLEAFAKQTNRDPNKLLDEVISKVKGQYDSLFECFGEVAESGESALIEVGLDKKLVSELTQVIQQKIKKPSVIVNRTFSISCESSSGVNEIKRILLDAEKKFPNTEISYIGAPFYRVVLEDASYKEAESKLEKMTELVEAGVKKVKGDFSVKKND